MVRKLTEYIVIHCSATPAKMDVDVKTIEGWHKAKGFLSVGYHYVIKRNGTRQKGRNLNDVGAHCVGYNHKSVGVCLVGGMDAENKHPENNFTDAQWAALSDTLHELKGAYPAAKIVGHRELDRQGKECPSFDVQLYLLTKEIP